MSATAALEKQELELKPALKNVTVNKLGGDTMLQLDKVAELVHRLDRREENIVLVVSAFRGVTNALIAAMDRLSGTDYQNPDIDREFAKVEAIHLGVIGQFFEGDYKTEAERSYQDTYFTLRKALLAHRTRSNILMPREGSYEIRDAVIRFGEYMSGILLEIFLRQRQYATHFFRDVECQGYQHTARNGTAVSKRRLHKAMQTGIADAAEKMPLAEDIALDGRKRLIRIFGGHVNKTPHGMEVDVGRSYSDQTAVIGALALRDDCHERVTALRFYKKVSGVQTASPKVLGNNKSKAVVHRHISLTEGLEMAAAEGGTGLMQVGALALARRNNLPLQLCDIDDPDAESKGTEYMVRKVTTKHAFKTIVLNNNVDTLTVTIAEMADQAGFAAALTTEFKKRSLNIDGFFFEGTSITFLLPLPPDESLREAYRSQIKALGDTFEEEGVEVDGEIYEIDDLEWGKGDSACISLIGHELSGKRGVASILTGAFSTGGINIDGISHSKSQTRVSVLVKANEGERAVRLLHAIFVERDPLLVARFREEIMRIFDDITGTFLPAAA